MELNTAESVQPQNDVISNFKANLREYVDQQLKNYLTTKHQAENNLRINISKVIGGDLSNEQFKKILDVCGTYAQTVRKPFFVPPFSKWNNEILNFSLPEFEYTFLDDHNLLEWGNVTDDSLCPRIIKKLNFWLTRLNVTTTAAMDGTTTVETIFLTLQQLEEQDINEASVLILLNEILVEVIEVLPECVICVEDHVKFDYGNTETPHGFLDYSFYQKKSDGCKEFLGLMEAKRGNANCLDQARVQATVQLITKASLEIKDESKNFFAVATTGYKFCFLLLATNEIQISQVYLASTETDLRRIISIFRGLLMLTATSTCPKS